MKGLLDSSETPNVAYHGGEAGCEQRLRIDVPQHKGRRAVAPVRHAYENPWEGHLGVEEYVQHHEGFHQLGSVQDVAAERDTLLISADAVNNGPCTGKSWTDIHISLFVQCSACSQQWTSYAKDPMQDAPVQRWHGLRASPRENPEQLHAPGVRMQGVDSKASRLKRWMLSPGHQQKSPVMMDRTYLKDSLHCRTMDAPI